MTRTLQGILYFKLPNQLSRHSLIHRYTSSFTHRYSSSTPNEPLFARHFHNTMAQAESSATASKRAQDAAPGSLPESLLATAHELKRHKARSLDTARVHLKTVEERAHEVVVGLLGDSMIERMGSTGQWDTLESWPSETMASDAAILAMNDAGDDTDATPIARLQGVANFGCGGDKIENVLFRVLGDTDMNLKGLARELGPTSEGCLTKRRNQKLWVIQAGTNNIHKTQGLRDADLHSMEILLKTLHHLSRPGTKFLVTGLFYRMNIPKGRVDQANDKLKSLVARLCQEFPDAPRPTEQSHGGKGTSGNSHNRDDSGISGGPWDGDNGTFSFLPAPEISKELLEDHVHLRKEGYQKWMQTLLPKVHEILRIPPPPDTTKPGSPSFSGKDKVQPFYPSDAVTDGQPSSD